MSKYVDADELMRNIPNEEMLAKMAVAHAPSIDIVRCCECNHWHKKDDLTYCDRIDYGYGYKADDFCSRGKRIDEYEKEYRELGLYELRELRQADERSE